MEREPSAEKIEGESKSGRVGTEKPDGGEKRIEIDRTRDTEKRNRDTIGPNDSKKRTFNGVE